MAKRKRLISREVEQRLAHGIGIPFAWHVLKRFSRTWKIERVGDEHSSLKPAIFAIYHGDLVVGAFELPRLLPNVDVLTSRSRDGALVTRFVHMFKGPRTIRGGSSKGGTGALLQMRRSLLNGRAVIIPIDGPRGPEGVVKPGVIAVASQSGAPIIPGAVLSDKVWRMKSWDRMMICKPFARVKMIYGDPFYVEPNADRDLIEKRRLELENILRDLHQQG